MQHIVLRTANPNPLLNNPGWAINGVGRRISNKFGYGLMDAGALVKLARVWQTVPEQHMCTYEYILDAPRFFFFAFKFGKPVGMGKVEKKVGLGFRIFF